jgi:aryl-alcohol dehydrogenase-like predicted oxidoreductase
VDERAGIELIRAAVDLGVTLFDNTAEVYGPYANEVARQSRETFLFGSGA